MLSYCTFAALTNSKFMKHLNTKQLGLFAITMVIAFTTKGQNHSWTKTLGVSPETTLSRAVALDQSGNVYTTGNFVGTIDFDPGVGVSSLTSAGIKDVFISKLDPAGNFLWAKKIGGVDNTTDVASALSMTVVPDDRIYRGKKKESIFK